MSYLVNPFARTSRAGSAWFCAGSASSYPNTDGATRIGEQQLCHELYITGCKIFHVPREDSSRGTEIAIDDWKDPGAGSIKDQVMVFQYKGKYIAIDHVCLIDLGTFSHLILGFVLGMVPGLYANKSVGMSAFIVSFV